MPEAPMCPSGVTSSPGWWVPAPGVPVGQGGTGEILSALPVSQQGYGIEVLAKIAVLYPG